MNKGEKVTLRPFDVAAHIKTPLEALWFLEAAMTKDDGSYDMGQAIEHIFGAMEVVRQSGVMEGMDTE
jgi:DNA-binding phage protein